MPSYRYVMRGAWPCAELAWRGCAPGFVVGAFSVGEGAVAIRSSSSQVPMSSCGPRTPELEPLVASRANHASALGRVDAVARQRRPVREQVVDPHCRRDEELEVSTFAMA